MAQELRSCDPSEAVILILTPKLFAMLLAGEGEESCDFEESSENLKTQNTDYQNTHKDPDIQERLAKKRAERSRESGGSSSGTKAVPNPNLERGARGPVDRPAEGKPKVEIPHSSGIPGLEELLQEYADVFPEDLPAELPIKREFEMKIPLKPDAQPQSQVLHWISSSAREAVMATLEYLYSHGMARD
eukprot:185713-Rhodomonas_salina.1